MTGEVSSIVMKSDETIVKARAELEAVETLLMDPRITKELSENIRQHFRQSQSSSSFDQSALYRFRLNLVKLSNAGFLTFLC